MNITTEIMIALFCTKIKPQILALENIITQDVFGPLYTEIYLLIPCECINLIIEVDNFHHEIKL